MPNSDQPAPFPANRGLEERLAALQRTAAFCPPHLRRVAPIAGATPQAGQVWQTQQFGGDPEETDESYDPCWVILLARFDDYGEVMFEAAPIFTETEMATEEDAVLPRSLLGFSCGVAIGTPITVLRGSLKHCEGALPREWIERLLAFHREVKQAQFAAEDSADAEAVPVPPAGLQVGVPCLDRADPAFAFHQEFLARLDYLQQPVLEWVNRPVAASLLDQIAAAIQARISQWLSIRWIPELELWNARMEDALSAGEAAKFSGKESYRVPRHALSISVKPEKKNQACWFFVAGPDKNGSLALDGSFIVGADSPRAIRIDGGQALVPLEEVVRGFVVVSADGSVIPVESTEPGEET